jgi:hypothetical protein
LSVEGLQAIWSLKEKSTDEYEKYIIMTFIGRTIIYGLDEENQLSEIENSGIDSNSKTLLCSNLVEDYFVQITSSSLLLFKNFKLVDKFEIKSHYENSSIQIASSKDEKILISISGKIKIKKKEEKSFCLRL